MSLRTWIKACSPLKKYWKPNRATYRWAITEEANAVHHQLKFIEKVSIIGNTAIVMGREEVNPKGVTDNAGKKVIRRYTNVWMKLDHKWRLVARQATITVIQ